MKWLEDLFVKYEHDFEEGGKYERGYPIYELIFTFFFTPKIATHSDAHVRDTMDMKRLMIFVLFALAPAIVLGMWNVGNQGFIAEGVQASFGSALFRGAQSMLPIIIMSYTAGGIAEMIFAVVRKHEINEGFLVTAMLYPLSLPPSIPLWMVAMGIVFGVVIGKEVFGGVGMNILNPALTARAFVFFAYPAVISGAKVWDVSGGTGGIVSGLLSEPAATIDGYTGATALLTVSTGGTGAQAVTLLNEAPSYLDFSWMSLFLGTVPGSMGEVSAAAALLGAVFLVATGIASWRIMVACVVGLAATTAIFNGVAGPENAAMMTLPPHYHLVMGGFAFGAVFMATDPVSSANTKAGQWMYGILIGVMCALVRVVNPAYPEGMMLAILFGNVFAPLFDYYVVKASTRRRVARLAAKAA